MKRATGYPVATPLPISPPNNLGRKTKIANFNPFGKRLLTDYSKVNATKRGSPSRRINNKIDFRP
jgi:hypothetical protein